MVMADTIIEKWYLVDLQAEKKVLAKCYGESL